MSKHRVNSQHCQDGQLVTGGHAPLQSHFLGHYLLLNVTESQFPAFSLVICSDGEVLLAGNLRGAISDLLSQLNVDNVFAAHTFSEYVESVRLTTLPFNDKLLNRAVRA